MDEEVKKRLNWIINTLPEPHKSEFVEEVLVDGGENYDMRTLNKVFGYYIDDCYNELPKSVIEKISEKYMIIELR